MTINRVGPTDPITKYSNANKVQPKKQIESDDSINVSKSAMSKSELIKASTIANNAPDIREDRVADVKAKLANPNYINETVINSVADKIMEDFGL